MDISVRGVMKKKSLETGLTELESHVLSLIWRMQPVSAYQIRQAFARSPTREVALSQGSIYPAVERLKRRDYVRASALNDGRKTEHLTCTAAGERAISAWVRDAVVQLPEDPLRTRVTALSILSESERVEWARAAKTSLLRNLADLEEFAQTHPGPYLEMAHDNARATLLARVRWIERVEAKLTDE